MSRSTSVLPLSNRAVTIAVAGLCLLIRAHSAAAVDCNANGIEDSLDLLPSGFGFAAAANYAAADTPLWIVAADLNGDGDIDLATANELANNVSVLLNDGDGTFAARVNYGVHSHPWCVAAADLDGDHDVDLVTANYVDEDVSVLLNNGNGTFAAAVHYPAGWKGTYASPATGVDAGDVDGDGDNDLAVSYAGGYAHGVCILRNSGSAVFAAPETYGVSGSPSSVVLSDHDGDGDLDMAVSGASAGIAPLSNAGDGTYSTYIEYVAGGGGKVRSADFNGDNRADLVTVSSGSDEVSVFISVVGGFEDEVEYAVGDGPESVAIGDVTGDGNLDLVVANYRDHDVSVLPGNGDGTFTGRTDFAVHDYPRAVTVADLDDDGFADVATSNTFLDDVSVLLNQSVPAHSKDCNSNGVPDECDIAGPTSEDCNGNSIPDECDIASGWSGDCNANGVPDTCDIASGSREDCNTNGVPDDCETDCNCNDIDDALELAGTAFTYTSRPIVFNSPSDTVKDWITSMPPAAGAVTFVVWGGNVPPATVVVRINGHTMGAAVWSISGPLCGTTTSVFGVAAEAFNAALEADGSEEITIVITGTRACGSASAVRLTLAYPAVPAADCNANGIPDECDFLSGLAKDCNANHVPDSCDVAGSSEDCNGNGIPDECDSQAGVTFNLTTTLAAGNGTHAVVAADFDRNGQLDLAAANYLDDNVSVFEAVTWGAWSPAVNYTMGDNPFGLATLRLNAGLYPDLVTANYNSDNITSRLNNGDGTFGASTARAAANGPWFVHAADLDGDTDEDVICVNYLADNVSLFENQGGTLVWKKNLDVEDGPVAVVAADLDNDIFVWKHLAVCNFGSHSVSILRNEGGWNFASAVNYAAGKHPRAIQAATLDGDGIPDLAITNADTSRGTILLTNPDGTLRKAWRFGTGSNPQGLAAADLDGDGDMDLASANRGSDNISVLLNRGDATFGAPMNFAAGDGPVSIVAAYLSKDARSDLAVANVNSDNVSVLINVLMDPIDDADGDGVMDPCDDCPGTIPGASVDAGGCPPLIPGDFNRDGDVDLTDLAQWIACGSGASVPPPSGCDGKDLDDDGDVDADDFGRFQRCFSGQNHPGDPACAG